MRRYFLAVIAALLCAATATVAAAESWAVELTRKQTRGLSEMMQAAPPAVFAISPDGAWGWAYGHGSVEGATTRALGYCRQNLRKGQRDCLVYAVNGAVVAPAVVETRRVQAVYKPVNGRAAAATIGLADVTFRGDRAAAEAQLAALTADPATRSRLRNNSALRRTLTGRSIVSDSRSGFAIWFDPQNPEQHMQANSGILRLGYRGWVATAEGLVCMFDGAWMSTGKGEGTRCIILHSVDRGRIKFSWSGSTGKIREGFLVAGDARIGAVR